MPSFAGLAEVERDALVAYLFHQDTDAVVDREALTGSWADDIPFLATGHHEFRDPQGYPVNKRPWGTLNAIDLNQGTIAWQVPLGTYPALEKQGFAATGTFNIGGPLLTGGGLIFIAAAMDERLHAFDKVTGKLVWEYQLDAGGYASPATYEVDGRQFIIIAAGGAGKAGTKAGNAYVSFALTRD
jgi:quinoprotein glucose dehydrogenase